MSISPHASRWRRALTIISLSTLALVAGGGIAAAHVTVNPSEAAAGSYTKLTFRVPNESPTAGTVALTVALPADHPIADVSVKQIPGWTATPTTTSLATPVEEGDITIKEAVTSVTWAADPGTMIGPGEFAEFDISVGPMPDVSSLEFPATQTYNDGTVVEWNEPTPASGEEPEHPAPTLTITDTAEGGPGHSDATGEATATTSASVTAAAAATPASGDSSSTATILAAVSLVIAASALVVAAVALRRRPTGHREG